MLLKLFFFYFFAKNFLQTETAAHRISRVLKVNQENEKMMEDYERMASDVSYEICVTKTIIEIISST